MKHISLILIFTLALSLFAYVPAASVENPDASPNFVQEDFSDGVQEQSTSALTITYTQNGAGIAKGAAHIAESSKYQTPKYEFGARKGQTYDISAWIKMDETPLIPYVQVIIYNTPADSNVTGTVFNSIKINNAGLEKDKWVKLSCTYAHNGTGRKPGDTTTFYETLPIGSIQFRIGTGIPSETTASGKVSYTIDDVTVMPREHIKMPISEENLVYNGDFEAENYIDGWTVSTNTSVAQIVGANGTNSAVDISVLKTWGAIYMYDADIRFGRQYRVSFWAKATSDEAIGKDIQVILSRTDGKTDITIPKYEYLYDSDDPYLESDWKYYELTYTNGLRTCDTIKPSIRFRAGDGTEVLSYAVDELQIYEIENNGILTSNYQLNGDSAHGCIYGYAGASGGLVQHCFYRLLAPFENDYAILQSGREIYNEIMQLFTADNTYDRIILEVQSVDYDGNAGPGYRTVYTKSELSLSATAEFNETVWNNEIPSLTASVTYRGSEVSSSLFAAIGYYSEKGKLLSLTKKKIPVTAKSFDTVEFSAPNNTAAATAKVFLWNEADSAPVQLAAQANKLTAAKFIYIDPQNGTNNTSASYKSPLKTLTQAKAMLKSIVPTAKNDIYVIFLPGEYPITSAQSFSSSEYSDDINVIFTSYNKNRKAKFTGGTDVTGFELYDTANNIYRAKVADGTVSRQLYVNGVRATKAKSTAPLSDAANIKQDADGNYLTKEEATLSGATVTDIGIRTSDTYLKDYKRVNDIELVFYEQWTSPRCQVSSIVDNSDGTILLVMDQKGWYYINHKGGTSVSVPVYIENALELLDEEGEWYLDTVDDYVYYKPRFFENMSSAQVVMPTTEKLFYIAGTTDAPIKNIRFDNIEFAETTWMRPSTTYGHSDAQNNHIREGSVDVLPDGTVEVENAHNVDFTNCSFNRMGTTALRYTGAVQYCDIVGNEFYELSAGGINMGIPEGDYDTVVNPSNEKYFITDNNISDNYIHRFAQDFMSATGTSATFPKNSTICHNEIFDGPYSGMHIGYGWGNFEKKGTATQNFSITNNYIHNVMNDNIYDGGAIYTNGATGGTNENPNIISENYIEDVGNYPGAIYPDEGSSYWKISKNVIDLSAYEVWTGRFGSVTRAPSWLHIWTSSIHDITLTGNYATTQNRKNSGTNITLEEAILPTANGWQTEALEIIAKSGIRPMYQQNFKYGLQKVAVPKTITLTVGEAKNNIPMCYTAKGKYYSKASVDIYAHSSDSTVASVDNFIISANSPGETIITYYLIEQGILTTAQVKVIVE